MFVSVVIFRSTAKGMSSGYSVSVFHGQDVIASYTAGANLHCSQSPGESSLATVRKWAISTANEMFAERAGRNPTRNEIEIEIESPDEE